MSVEFTGEVHPFADSFPMISDDELDALAADIAENGLMHPIVLTPEGKLLDGRNRLDACQRAGVQPTFVVSEVDPVAFVLSVNVHRRHLSTGQRAMFVALGLVEQGKRENGRWKRGSVPEIPEGSSGTEQTWQMYVRHAGVVLDHAPDLVEDVLAGSSLAAVYEEARQRRLDAEERARTMAELRDRRPDLVEKVEAEAITVEDAVDLDRAQRERDDAERFEREQEAARARQRDLDRITEMLSGFDVFDAILSGDQDENIFDDLITPQDQKKARAAFARWKDTA